MTVLRVMASRHAACYSPLLGAIVGGQLGCWNPPVTISCATYETARDVFLHSRLITRRQPYEQVVGPPLEA